ncbi:MAG: polyprenyl synthetase family protein [Thermodesulfobacteriota bacterium]|nr:polyprenyl synthetase family protein [Thermodesulfobacteriota bacterium]
MFRQLKKKLDKELIRYIDYVDKRYGMHSISPSLVRNIREFVLRDGKRLRPILFICGYKGFSNKHPKNLFRSALAMEFLHDFLLVHDDLVDKSHMRRGKPTMHIMLNEEIKKKRNVRFTGQDLAIVIGDVMYAIAIETFLSIKENPILKEKALIKFIEAACYTGCGEYIEILSSSKDIQHITKNEIYKIYDYKTAYYTFVAPLVTGATLANAPGQEITQLFEFGVSLGRAFQIKDDILGIFGDEGKTGKSSFTDLEENKKTLLVWYAHQRASKTKQSQLKKIMNKGKLTKKDLIEAQEIIKNTGSLEYAQGEIKKLSHHAFKSLKKSKMNAEYKNALITYVNTILST